MALFKSPLIYLLLTVVMSMLSGCAAPQKRGWGSEVTISPGWERVKLAALNAVKDPGTWVPAVGATVVAVSGRDRELTESVIGAGGRYELSREAAESSDRHRTLLDHLWMVSLLATDSGPEGVVSNKLRGAFTQAAIVNVSIATTNGLKSVVPRAGPGDDLPADEHDGFPSNHSVPPFTQAALIRRNLRYIPVNKYARYPLLAASYGLASASAYGRVEAGLHFVSDQLAGAALGNFLGLLMHDAFFEAGSPWQSRFLPTLDESAMSIQLSRPF